MSTIRSRKILVTGGAGYVGSLLVPKLLASGHEVTVLDLYLFGTDVLSALRNHRNLKEIRGDIRDQELVFQSLKGCDSVIHLACISNDPSFDLNPELGRQINYEAFISLVDNSIAAGIDRFVYASSSSVYGIKKDVEVTEELSLEPLTDYSKYKALCEEVLLARRSPNFETLIIRPATVCGYSPRLRLDLTVNILTNHAVNNGVIKVFGGEQTRPNIHIDDMTDLYVECLNWPRAIFDGQVYNVGYENHSVITIAKKVRTIVGDSVLVKVLPTDDRRANHISSDRVFRKAGFHPRRSIDNAVQNLLDAFRQGKIENSMEAPKYFNIKLLQSINFC